MEESAPNATPSANASACVTPAPSRGRGRGRPPKVAASFSDPAQSARTPTPTPAADSPTPTDDADATCRRSSRKKTIKFDVRDLLNKNRKGHKIQIEARIDSSPSGNAGAGAAAAGSRLFSMFESNQQALPPPPPPALEIFAKPRPTQSLIVAQVTSEPGAGSCNSVQTVAALPVVATRKRGRPRKSQPLELAAPPAAAAAPAPVATSDSDTNSTSASTGSGGDSGEVTVEAKRKPKSKLRVSLKRLNMARRQESSDSGETNLGIQVVECRSSPFSSSTEAPILQDDNALDEQPPTEKQPLTISVPGDNSDSDSQIIFIEIETETESKGEEDEEVFPTAEESRESTEQHMMIDLIEDSQSLSDAKVEMEAVHEEILKFATVEEKQESDVEMNTEPEEIIVELVAPELKDLQAKPEPTHFNPEPEAIVVATENPVLEVVPPELEDFKPKPESVKLKPEPEDTAMEAEDSISEVEKVKPGSSKIKPEPEVEPEAIPEPAPEQTDTKPEIIVQMEVDVDTPVDTKLVTILTSETAQPDEEMVTDASKEEEEMVTEASKEPVAQSPQNLESPVLLLETMTKIQVEGIPEPIAQLTAPLEEEQLEEIVLDHMATQKSDTEVKSEEPKRDPAAPAILDKSRVVSELGVELELKLEVEKTEITVKTEPAMATEMKTSKTAEVACSSSKSLPEKKEGKRDKDPKKERRKSHAEGAPKKEREPEKSAKRKEKSPPEVGKKEPEKSLPGVTRKEPEKSQTELVGKKEKEAAPCEKKELPKSSPEASNPTENPAKANDSAEESAKPEQKKPPMGDSSMSKSKEKTATGFVECDAMFKAMDMANAQLRLEEKSKKKLKKAPPRLSDLAMPQSSSSPAFPPKKSSASKATNCRRNTVYEDSPKLERNSSPLDSDSSRVLTPVGGKLMKRTKAKKKPNPRRSTISVEGKDLAEEVLLSASSPVSTSSDASSRKNPSKRASPELGVSQTPGGSKLSKLELRRNTICEDRQAEVVSSAPVPLTKRRYSVHPKASANCLLAEVNRPSAKKKARKSSSGRDTTGLSRQDSMDGSLGRGSRRKSLKSTEALHAALVETESSESTSSGSKMRRWDVQPSPELEAPDPLKDIAKFIEDGVNLLKRDYKLEEGQEEEAANQEDEFAQRVANMETPATTPSPSPTSNPEDSSSQTATFLQDSHANGNGNGGGAGVRRSHRIKQKPQGPKASQGRGVTSMALAPISMEEQLSELANIESINEQFLRSEGLNVFQHLRENYYRCARQVSQENAEMQCDCFLTGDEEAQGHLCCGAGCINRMLMIECGPLCTNRERCTNKRFQQHQCWPCRVFRTEKKGCGITAELQIPPGEFIMEYVGEVIDSEEFERRQHLYSRDRKRHYYFMALRGEAIIDATAKGNISRYINHSCDPNAETQKWTVNGELRIGFFSVKTIQPGDEITFDYQYQRYGRDAQRCYCEAANCRGWIGGEPDSDEGEQLDVSTESEQELEEEDLDVGGVGEAVEGRKLPKSKAGKAKHKAKLLASAAGKGKRKEQQQAKTKDREYKAGRWLKPSGGGASSSGSGTGEKTPHRKPKVNKFQAMLEDPDVLEEVTLLSRSGLKNQLDTLRFSRCMVRAKLLQTRLQLLGVLTRGELPCRRLFLDYHGLRLLHAWISENGNDNQLRLALLDALEALPIPNRTMLNDSKVYQSIQLWSSNLDQKQLPPTGAAGEGDADAAKAQADAARARPRMAALLQKWHSLPEIFRIPKRERIEQMKEHEREADRQQKHVHASTALEDQRERESSSDRYRQDRFRRDTTSGRNNNGKPTRMSGNNTICTITTQPKGSNGSMEGGSMMRSDGRRRSDMGPSMGSEPRRMLSKELRRSLFERKVALDEAEKRVCSEDRREHELRCEFFAADPGTDPKQLPFYQNTDTGQWFNSENMPVPTPHRTDLQAQSLLSPEPEPGPQGPLAMEYKLPAGVDPLPPSWNWGLTSDGDIYYYNLSDRISQWEPPSPEQRLQTLVKENPEQQPLQELQIDPALLATELIQVDGDYVGTLSAKSLTQYIEGKVKERRELRRNRLVSIRVISPRRDEDRLYNQLESRKYKENKEKIRRRKELYRRRRLDTTTAAVSATTPATAPAPSASDKPEDAPPSNSLPIQGYLYSSDEEDAPPAQPSSTEGAVAEVLDELNMEPSTSQAAAALAALGRASAGQEDGGQATGSKRKLPMPPLDRDHRSKKAKRWVHLWFLVFFYCVTDSLPSFSSSGSDSHDKFRYEISGHVAEYLRPYRKESCKVGRLTSDEDYKFLVKRLSHHITTKEMRYCDTTGHPLACTESVRHKSFAFIQQYMRKKGRVYKRPPDEHAF
ncbi:hypothetical protein KR009_004246 [Drosophila setifemur]|nr:hypothetical protein KR009_004246 [Drosophila setifemur]